MIIAASNGYKDIVNLLINNGADVNAKYKDGCTALMVAAKWGHHFAVENLLNNRSNIDVDARANNDVTALMLAADNGHTPIVEALLSKGADINTKSKDGDTALIFASKKGYKEIVELLLDKGAKVNAKNKWGTTALLIAVDQGYTNIVDILLKYGADPNEKNDDGLSALKLSKYKGYIEITELLERPTILRVKKDRIIEDNKPMDIQNELSSIDCHNLNDLNFQELVENIAKIGEPVIDPIIELVLKTDDKWLVAKALYVLRKIGELSVIPLIELFEKSNNEDIKCDVAMELGEIGSRLAVDPLIKGLKDSNKYIRNMCAEALGRIGDSKAVPHLIKILFDPDQTFYVVIALGEIGDKSAIIPLIQVLKNKKYKENIRSLAANALGKIREPSVLEPLFDAAKEFTIVEAFFNFGVGAVPSLIEALKDEKLRWSASIALGEIGDNRAVTPLSNILNDKNPNVRSVSATALAKLGAVKELLNSLMDINFDSRGVTGELEKILDATHNEDTKKRIIKGFLDYLNSLNGKFNSGAVFAAQALIDHGFGNDIKEYLLKSKTSNGEYELENIRNMLINKI